MSVLEATFMTKFAMSFNCVVDFDSLECLEDVFAIRTRYHYNYVLNTSDPPGPTWLLIRWSVRRFHDVDLVRWE
jgi:hypothetical protein